ncbi:hypothetical protein VTN31DRAFT_4839 [Thermomyces dupontii]|uniref:uncharacterized protein n=1 Tax=Talaromyces thermophilus TaxID=28565 RepID=UPI003744257F
MRRREIRVGINGLPIGSIYSLVLPRSNQRSSAGLISVPSPRLTPGRVSGKKFTSLCLLRTMMVRFPAHQWAAAHCAFPGLPVRSFAFHQRSDVQIEMTRSFCCAISVSFVDSQRHVATIRLP